MRYVAIGDSFTEGVGDARPDGSLRGWADIVATSLARIAAEPISYANLAVRGRLLMPIVREQLDAALALSPTMLTLNGGGNDMLRPGMDAGQLVELTEQAARRVVDAGVQLVLIAGPDPGSGLPFGDAISRRGAALTDAMLDLGARLGVTTIDVYHDLEIRRSGYWAEDRLHLNPAGHHRVAHLIMSGLGHPDVVPAMPPGDDRPRTPLAELAYYRRYVLPWMARRARGRSSGDGRRGKHETWTTVEPR